MHLTEIFIVISTIYIVTIEAQTVFTMDDMMVTTDSSSEEIGEEPLDGSNTRGIVSDIATIKKVVEVIQTVGGKVIPAIIEGQKAATDVKPTRFKLLKALKTDNKEDVVVQPEE